MAGGSAGTACEDFKEMCNKHRPKPAPEAFINSGPCAGTTAPQREPPRQRMIGLGPDHTPATTSLLCTRRQQSVVMTPLRASVAVVRNVFHKKTPGSLRAPNWQSAHPIPLPLLCVGGNHHKLPHRLRPRAFLVALGPETNELARRRRVTTVTRRCDRRKVRKARNIDCLYCRLAYRRATPTEDCTESAHETLHVA